MLSTLPGQRDSCEALLLTIQLKAATLSRWWWLGSIAVAAMQQRGGRRTDRRERQPQWPGWAKESVPLLTPPLKLQSDNLTSLLITVSLRLYLPLSSHSAGSGLYLCSWDQLSAAFSSRMDYILIDLTHPMGKIIDQESKCKVWKLNFTVINKCRALCDFAV